MKGLTRKTKNMRLLRVCAKIFGVSSSRLLDPPEAVDSQLFSTLLRQAVHNE